MGVSQEVQVNRSNPVPILMLAVLIIVAGMLALNTLAGIQPVELEPEPVMAITQAKEVTNPSDAHAVERHGVDAVLVEQKCQQNGVYSVYREGKDLFHQICLIEQGKYGDWIIRKFKDGHFETVTRLIPKDGTWQRIMQWLSNKNATRFTGPF